MFRGREDPNESLKCSEEMTLSRGARSTPSDEARTHQSGTSFQGAHVMGTHFMVSLSPTSCSGTHPAEGLCDSVESLPDYQHMVIRCISLDIQGRAVSILSICLVTKLIQIPSWLPTSTSEKQSHQRWASSWGLLAQNLRGRLAHPQNSW